MSRVRPARPGSEHTTRSPRMLEKAARSTYYRALDELRVQLITAALGSSGNDVRKAAGLLGLTPGYLWRLIQHHGIKRPVPS